MTPSERIVAELRALPVAEVHARIEAVLVKQRQRAGESPDHPTTSPVPRGSWEEF